MSGGEAFEMNFDGEVVENGATNLGASAMARAIQKAVENVDLDDSDDDELEEGEEWEYEDDEEGANGKDGGGGGSGSYSDNPKSTTATSGASAYRRGDMIVKMPPMDVLKKQNATGGGVLGIELPSALNIFGGDGDEKAKFHRFPEYSVSFEKGPICLNLEQDVQHGHVAVISFRPKEDGSAGPAKLTGMIDIGHALIGVNGDSIIGMSFKEVLMRLKKVSPGEHTLQFADTTGSTSTKNKMGGGSGAYDAASRKALAAIHQEKMKYYMPPKEPSKDNSKDGMELGFVEIYEGDYVTSFHFHRQSDSKFICAASIDGSMKGPFILHLMHDMAWEAKLSDIPTSEGSSAYLGCLVSNMQGTEFTARDYRIKADDDFAKKDIHELVVVRYDVNIMGRIPNSMTVLLPRWDLDAGERQQYTLTERHRIAQLKKEVDTNKKTLVEKAMAGELADKESIIDYKSVNQHDQADLLTMMTRKPKWCTKLEAWTLDFKGRVKKPSKKNFLMCVPEDDQQLVDEFGAKTNLMRFGKVTDDRYSLDYRYPLSPIQALCIALSSFSDKLVVT